MKNKIMCALLLTAMLMATGCSKESDAQINNDKFEYEKVDSMSAENEPNPDVEGIDTVIYNGESILLTEDASFISELGELTNSNDNQVDGRPGVSVQKKYFEDNSISVATITDNDKVFFDEICIDSPSVELSNGIKIGATAKEVKDVYSINDDSFKCFTYTGCLNEDRITTTYNFGNYEVFFDFGGPSGASDKKIDGEEKLEHIRIIYKPIQQKYTMSAD
ncbi:MAG: hypothetical protein K5769_01805 [Pseudobutyrivibrio sp.]|nr:hypothetical protein [Pseudobutyrivibrio sp.]